MRRFLLGAITAALVVAPSGLGAVAADAATGAHAAAVRATGWPVVRPGARGERVWVIQYLLNQHGVRVAVDGAYGRSTTAAVKTFQRSKRLVADGIVGGATWQKLDRHDQARQPRRRGPGASASAAQPVRLQVRGRRWSVRPQHRDGRQELPEQAPAARRRDRRPRDVEGARGVAKNDWVRGARRWGAPQPG